jgi:GNAT superfamily N-acetyltransferase
MTTVIESLGSGWTPPLPDLAAPTAPVTVTSASTADTDAALAMLSRCSRDSLYHRFHGYTDGVAYTRRLLNGPAFGHRPRLDPNSGDQPPLVDESFLAWDHSTCIGMATISSDDAGVPHLGVLVEDGWQRRGIGTLLIQALIDAARWYGLTRVHADVLGEDQFVIKALRRVGPLKLAIVLGTYEVDIDL